MNEALFTAVGRQETLSPQTPHVGVRTRAGEDGTHFTLRVELRPNFHRDWLKIVRFLELLSFQQYAMPLHSISDNNWEKVDEGGKPLFVK